MKIIIPVDEASVESGVCVSFGRAPYFMLCEGGKAEFLPNPGAEAEGGAGLKAAQTVADSGAEALITVRCGENAAQVLKASGHQDLQVQGRARRSKTPPRSRRGAQGS